MNGIKRKVKVVCVFVFLSLVTLCTMNFEIAAAENHDLDSFSAPMVTNSVPTFSLASQPDVDEDNVGIFGASSFNTQFSNENRTFSGTFRGRAAELSLLGCLLGENCNWVQQLSSLIRFIDFSKGEQVLRSVNLRLEGEPGARAIVVVESNLDGLLAVGHLGAAGTIAKVQANLFIQPTGGIEETVIDFEEDLGTGTISDPAPLTIHESGSTQVIMTVGDELRIHGKLRAEANSLAIPGGGTALGVSQFYDTIGIPTDPPLDIPNPGLDFEVRILENTPPEIGVAHDVITVDEGQAAINNGSWFDEDGNPVALHASIGTLTAHSDGSWDWFYQTSDGPDDSQPVTITAADGFGGTTHVTFAIVVENVAPTIFLGGKTLDLEGANFKYGFGIEDPGEDTFLLIDASCGERGTIYNIIFDGNSEIGSGNFDCVFDGPVNTQVTVIAADYDGAVATASLAVTALNVAPIVSLVEDQTVYRNEPVYLYGTWDDPVTYMDDPYTYEWDLDGDGVPDTSGTTPYTLSAIPAQVSFSEAGSYTVTLWITDKDGGTGSDSVVVEVLNRPPDCTQAAPTVAQLWPANHKFVAVNVEGVTDPDGDLISLAIDNIYQDEAVDAPGSGDTMPDGRGIGTDTAELRAERAGSGNGRVYHIMFTAFDGHGGTCSGEVLVGVPRNKKNAAVDDGPLYDSTIQ